jgi:hypothetical protein
MREQHGDILADRHRCNDFLDSFLLFEAIQAGQLLPELMDFACSKVGVLVKLICECICLLSAGRSMKYTPFFVVAKYFPSAMATGTSTAAGGLLSRDCSSAQN